MTDPLETPQETQEIVKKKLNRLLLEAKDTLEESDVFKLSIFRKNLVTKILTQKTSSRPPFVLLLAVSYLDSKRMLEVVSGCLQLINKRVDTPLELDNSFIERFIEFMNENGSIVVQVEQSSIYVTQNGKALEIFKDDSLDSTATYILARSLCVLLAMTGKTVSNNFDKQTLNDYGCVSMYGIADVKN